MESDEIENMVDDALLKGIIEAECVECGHTTQCEADATTAWCNNCSRAVKVRNFMKHLGFI
jgi:ribosomal protein S27E